MSLEGKSRTNKAYRLSVGDPGEIRTGTDQLGRAGLTAQGQSLVQEEDRREAQEEAKGQETE